MHRRRKTNRERARGKGQGKNSLRTTRIGEILMIRRDVFLEVRIRFHSHDILDGGKDCLDKAIKLGDIGELGIEDLSHERAGRGGIMDLNQLYVRRQIWEGCRQLWLCRVCGAHHSPPLSPIPRHQTPHHGTMHLNHVLPILLLTQPFLPIPHNRQHEFLARLLALQ